jgi:hypothetical protein
VNGCVEFFGSSLTVSDVIARACVPAFFSTCSPFRVISAIAMSTPLILYSVQDHLDVLFPISLFQRDNDRNVGDSKTSAFHF